ncbi:Lipase GDSL, partial [Penicillium cataractarum]
MWHSTPVHWVVHFCLAWLVLLCGLVVAEPVPVSVDVVSRSTGSVLGIEESSSSLQKRDNGTFLLRIMPLGASITLGYRSTDHNGYRKALRQQLRYEGWQVNMIGSLRNGTMHDNHHEGHYGYRIDQLESKIQQTILQKPNLILINAGTNDAVQNHQITTAGLRMNTLLTTLYTSIPNTTIILSTLLPNKKHQDRVDQISAQYRNLVALRREQNDRIVLADMSSFIKASQLVDGTHPDDQGYREMAAVWWAAVKVAETEGLMQFAEGTGEDGRISDAAEGKLDGGIVLGILGCRLIRRRRSRV